MRRAEESRVGTDSTINSDIQHLISWSAAQGTLLHPAVCIYHDPSTGVSFRANEDIVARASLVTSSHLTTLSYLNVASALPGFQLHGSPELPAPFMADLTPKDPNIISHFFLLQQYLLKEQSFWWAYIRLLPQPDEPGKLGIPVWWPEADQRWLDGTNAEPPIKRKQELWNQEWRRGIVLLEESKFEAWEEYTYILYPWAATIFGSRSFRPSLTVESSSFANDSLTLSHIQNDRFSVLFPVLDIGNHNGDNQVSWIKDPTTNTFSLENVAPIGKGSQIYNYYGDKSNSELLVGYGFTLPDTKFDKVNLKVTPSPQATALRRSQKSHSIPVTGQPEQEFMFHVQKATGEGAELRELKIFSAGLFDTMICMVANSREERSIRQDLESSPEKDTLIFERQLARAAFQGLVILQMKLQHEISRLEATKPREGIPKNRNQELALDYRTRQINVLQAAISPLSTRISMISNQDASFKSSFTSSDSENQSSKSTRAEFISLETAFTWLQTSYPETSQKVETLIAEDQEESVPLNWAVLVEDWDHTYWIVWLYLAYRLHDTDPEFQSRHRKLSNWLTELKNTCGDREGYNEFHAESSEQATVNHMIQGMNVIVGGEINGDEVTTLRNLCSLIAREESVRAPYTMRTGPQEGELVEQKLLCIR